jgi:L-asparaginase
MRKAVLASDLGGAGMEAAVRRLAEGRSALDAVEEGARRVEADPSVRHVGLGGDPNLLGQMEFDAGIMDGTTLMAGAVGALRDCVHAVSVARAVMERLPHVMLVGEGASRFAREVGHPAVDALADSARAAHAAWVARDVEPVAGPDWRSGPLAPHAWAAARRLGARDTVVFLAVDGASGVAAATSTSGWAYKYPGRLGDSPVVGAGFYARNGAGACGCTHTGEMTIRACTAASVVGALARGRGVRDACAEAAADLRALRGGHLGGVVIHGMDAEGAPCVLCAAPMQEPVTYWFWQEGMPGPELRSAEVASA